MMLTAVADGWRTPHPVVTTRSSGGHDAPLRVLQDQQLAPFATAPGRQALISLQALPANWDGYGSAAPRPDAVIQAMLALPVLFNAATSSGHSWMNPHVSVNEDGNVVLEWWLQAKKLTVYVSSREMSYVRVWGDDIDNEMDDGRFQSVPANFIELWNWINA